MMEQEDKIISIQNKISTFAKNYLWVTLEILLCVCYCAYGIFTLKPSNESILVVLANCMFSLTIGTAIKFLSTSQGIMSGENSKIYLAVLTEYNKKAKSLDGKNDKLEYYVYYKNTNRLMLKRKMLLESKKVLNITYEEYLKGVDFSRFTDKKMRKEAKKLIKKVDRTTIKSITVTMINSPTFKEKFSDDSEILTINTKKYTSKTMAKSIVSTLLIGIIPAYFIPYLKDGIDVGKIIITALTIILYLVLAIVQYINGYNFVVNSMRAKILLIMNYIDEFVLICENNPELLGIKEKEETIKEEKIWLPQIVLSENINNKE